VRAGTRNTEAASQLFQLQCVVLRKLDAGCTLLCVCACRWCPDLRAVKLHTADPEERKRLKKEVRTQQQQQQQTQQQQTHRRQYQQQQQDHHRVHSIRLLRRSSPQHAVRTASCAECYKVFD
jgi:hypothetical protein